MAGQTVSTQDGALVQALRQGDESAFAYLLDSYHNSMVRIAALFVGDRALAEDVAQETWVAVLKGIDRFEGRSSLKTWIFSILTNRAKTRSQRESRTVPFSALNQAPDEEEAFEPAVDPSRFKQDGWWREDRHPHSWGDTPEDAYLSTEIRACVQRAIEALPANQRQVITLRDIDGWESDEVCNVLGISETNQRVLLHRARSKVRGALERYFDER